MAIEAPEGAGPARAPGDILLLSTADWDHPLWTNKQHVAVELARSGRRVLYVDSLGVRELRADGRDVRRALRRLARAMRRPREVRPGLWVCSPLRLPGQRHALVRAANRRLLAWSLSGAERACGVRPTTLWTYSPRTAELLDLRRFERVAYHAVDDVAAQPGMPAEAIRAAERELVGRADRVFCTAPALTARHAAAAAQAPVLLPNVADAAHFGRALEPELAVPADLARLPSPVVGFVGAVSGYKLDFALVRALAERRPAYSFVLIGPVGEGEAATDTAPLRGLPNLHLLGWRAYGSLPAYMKGMDVAMLPAASNPYTAAMFPMKFFEYLAAGRPVVATPLPALEAYEGLAIVAPGEPAAFAAALDRALAGDGPTLAERLAAAREHTYAGRTRTMLALLDAA